MVDETCKEKRPSYIDDTAIVHPLSTIGTNCKIWHFSHIREGVKLGNDCIVGDFVYIDKYVKIGSRVKIQNGCQIYQGVEIEDGVFIGPAVVFTNDKYPRAINSVGELSSETDWQIEATKVCFGASIGANSTILPGITIGKYAVVGAGSVVTKSVPEFTLVIGNPAKVAGYVCKCGRTQDKPSDNCPACIKDLAD